MLYFYNFFVKFAHIWPELANRSAANGNSSDSYLIESVRARRSNCLCLIITALGLNKKLLSGMTPLR